MKAVLSLRIMGIFKISLDIILVNYIFIVPVCSNVGKKVFLTLLVFGKEIHGIVGNGKNAYGSL